MRIVETDNHGGGYPDEKFVNLPRGTRSSMQVIADCINTLFCKDDAATRYWKVVEDDYKLQPGFEP